MSLYHAPSEESGFYGHDDKLDGKTLGDVMLLEDTDPDGDIVWLYHEWWVREGPWFI
jgi:hypothetical protein